MAFGGSGRRVPYSRITTKKAIEDYESLGPLTQRDLYYISSMSNARRGIYFVTVYGYAGSLVARARYEELTRD